MPRVAIAGFQHETNTFSPLPTRIEHFEQADSWPGLTAGEDIFRVFSNLNIPIGGFLTEARDWDIVPILWASAEPGAPVSSDAFSTITDMICSGIANAGPVDGVYLDLHGAMVTADFPDGEGELLNRVRKVVGAECPISVSLDLHANISPQLIDLASVVAIFREYPHLDMADTGARAAKLLGTLIEQSKPFAKAFHQVPYLIPLPNQATDGPPIKLIYDAIPGLIGKSVVSADVACGFPAADIKDCGPSVLAYGTDQEAADAAADALLDQFLEIEPLFEDNLVSAQRASRAASNHKDKKPLVLADVQDNPGAGGSSDTTGLLHALFSERCQRTAIGVFCDGDIVQQASQSGLATQFSGHLGGLFGENADPPFEGLFQVEALSNGRFTCTGAMYAGCDVDLGPMACLRVLDEQADIRIVVSSKRFQCLDLAIFRHMGIEPTKQSVLAVKSTVHFMDDFKSIAEKIVFVEAHGSHPCRLPSVNYEHLRQGLRFVPA